MTLLDTIHHGIDRTTTMPGVRNLAKRRYVKRFERNREENLFLGVFDSFEEAARSAPALRPLGYDNEDAANMPYASVITASDYPAVFWLNRSFHEGLTSVFDLGGHLGVKYYAFRRVLERPQGLQWTVCDVPAVVRRGQDLARTRDPDGRLHFTEHHLEAASHDLLFASGSLQYLPFTLAELLARLHHKPRRLIINLTPIHATRSLFTLNSIGTAFCPYRVQARDGFIAALRSAGYDKRDEWQNTGKSMVIPFEEGCDVPQYSGFSFDRQG